MRTTVNIDDDVMRAARQLAETSGQTLGQVLSGLARTALAATGARRQRGGVTLLPVRPDARGATMEEVNRLRDELP